MNKSWYHFEGYYFEGASSAKIAIHAVDERAARTCLRLILRDYADEDWKFVGKDIE